MELQNPHAIEVIHEHLLGLEPGPLILNEMVSDQDISLRMSGVPTRVIHICFLTILDPRHKLDSPCVVILILMFVFVLEKFSMGVIP